MIGSGPAVSSLALTPRRTRPGTASRALPPRSAKVLGHANEHGISANTRFEVCISKDYPETGFDLAAFFDCLFTTWAPRPAGGGMSQCLKPDGAWMVV